MFLSIKNKFNNVTLVFFLIFFFFYNLDFLYDYSINYNPIVGWKIINILNNVYLNLIFFIILLIIVLYNYKVLCAVVLFFYIYSFEKNEYTYSFNILSDYWINDFTLSNGLSLIHPFFVYYVYINTIYFIFKKFDVNFKFTIKHLNNKIAFISLTALLLGSWWAQQELNWGGWWNWDFVELILFIFFIKYIILIHTKKKYLYILKKFLYFFFFYIFIFFFFVRLDIMKSVHSFNTWNFLEKFFIYIFLIIIILLLINIKINAVNSINFNIYIYKFNNLLVIKFIDIYNKFDRTIKFIIYLLNILIWCILISLFFNIYNILFYEIDVIEVNIFLKNITYYILFYIVLQIIKKKMEYIFFFMSILLLSNFIEVLIFYILVSMIKYVKTYNYIKVHLPLIIFFLFLTLFNDIGSYFLNTINIFINLYNYIDFNSLFLYYFSKIVNLNSNNIHFFSNFVETNSPYLTTLLNYSINTNVLTNKYYLNSYNIEISFLQYGVYMYLMLAFYIAFILNKNSKSKVIY